MSRTHAAVTGYRQLWLVNILEWHEEYHAGRIPLHEDADDLTDLREALFIFDTEMYRRTGVSKKSVALRFTSWRSGKSFRQSTRCLVQALSAGRSGFSGRSRRH